MTRLAWIIAALAVIPLAAGCASHRVESSVEVSPPAVDRPENMTTGSELSGKSLEAFIAHVREISRKARPNVVKTSLATVEASNPELAIALGALVVFPSAQRHIDVADAYRRAGILDKAHEHLALAARRDPGNAAAYDGMARIWRDWGFPNLALPDAHRAAYHAPASPEAQNTLGTVLQALGAREPARRHYRRALELNPRAAYALNNLCTLDLADGNPAGAVGHCEHAVRIAPGLAVAVRNLEHARALLRAASLEDPDGRH